MNLGLSGQPGTAGDYDGEDRVSGGVPRPRGGRADGGRAEVGVESPAFLGYFPGETRSGVR